MCWNKKKKTKKCKKCKRLTKKQREMLNANKCPYEIEKDL